MTTNKMKNTIDFLFQKWMGLFGGGAFFSISLSEVTALFQFLTAVLGFFLVVAQGWYWWRNRNNGKSKPENSKINSNE